MCVRYVCVCIFFFQKEFKNLKNLDLFNNEATSIDNYREKVFHMIPSLKYLDGWENILSQLCSYSLTYVIGSERFGVSWIFAQIRREYLASCICVYVLVLYVYTIAVHTTHTTVCVCVYIYKAVLKIAPLCMTMSGLTFPHIIYIMQNDLLNGKVHDGNDVYQGTCSWLHVNRLLNIVRDSYLEIANSAQQV